MSTVGRLVLAIVLLSAPWVTFLVLVTIAAVLYIVGTAIAITVDLIRLLISS